MSRKLGLAFRDQVTRVSSKIGHFKHSEVNWDILLPNFNPQKSFEKSFWRLTLLGVLAFLSFFILFLRLFHLQIVEGVRNRTLADGNRVQIKLIHAPRGGIFDRSGRVLARNEPGFRLGDKVISRDEALRLESTGDEKAKSLEIDHIRIYPFGEKTAHILGYVSEITAEELKSPKFKDYRFGDRIGRGGVEDAYEEILRGLAGGEVIEVDSKGQKLRALRKTDPIPGLNLHLSIDADLQVLTFDNLNQAVKKTNSCCGAALSLDPKSREILSLSSLPPFDPHDISSFLNAKDSPLINRAISGVYPPGSTFKIASSLAGLTSGKITPQTSFEDSGVIYIGSFKFSNWYFTQYGKKEGSVDLIKALRRSNDTFFYHLGQLTGETVLADTAKKLGLGKKLGIDIPGEEAGIVPDGLWKRQNLGEVWFPGDTLHLSIGQGFILTTPLQIANLTAIIAADGQSFLPHLALKITTPAGKMVREFKFKSINPHFTTKDLQLVKKGLAEVPKLGGTAWPFFSFPIETGGKTGTAEYGDPRGRTHAWYTAFAPLSDPKIVVTVLIEGGGEGSSVAAPVVKEIMRWYFSQDKNKLIQDIYNQATDSGKILGE